MGSLLRRAFGLSHDEVDFRRRGFRGGSTPGAREHVEAVGTNFLAGYHAGLETASVPALVDRLEALAPEWQGFAYEGAAMALYLLDRLTPWKRSRFAELLANERGDAHVYMLYVGAGWAHARLPFGFAAGVARLDPVLRWLAFDGYGFHQGFFHWPTAVEGPQEIPARVTGYGRRAFDQGLGRSLWFVDGHEVGYIPRTIAGFPAARRSDLWSGVGLAATYAGGVPRRALEELRAAAGPYLPEVAQGAAFAATTRTRAGNVAPHNELACQVFCGLSVAEAAAVSARAEPHGELGTPERPAYELWRQGIQDIMRGSSAVAELAAVAQA